MSEPPWLQPASCGVELLSRSRSANDANRCYSKQRNDGEYHETSHAALLSRPVNDRCSDGGDVPHLILVVSLATA